jgi:ribosome-associated translation inhibitor RaiA
MQKPAIMEIPTSITFRGMEPSAAVEDRMRALAQRLEHVCKRITRCDVVVEAPHRHHRQGRQFHVRIALAVPGREIVVSHDPGRAADHEDAYVAVRDSFEAARRQLADYVEQVRESAVDDLDERPETD